MPNDKQKQRDLPTRGLHRPPDDEVGPTIFETGDVIPPTSPPVLPPAPFAPADAAETDPEDDATETDPDDDATKATGTTRKAGGSA